MIVAHIFINDERIAVLALQRQGPLLKEGLGWHEYAIRSPREHAGKVVMHRYEDGWARLLKLALEAMEGGENGKG